MIISHLIPLDVNPIVANLPNALPANLRRSKAWRSHYICQYSNNIMQQHVFLIFVMDEKYGFCKHSMVSGRYLSVRRKGKTYLRFQCGYPKDRIVVLALHESCRSTDESKDLFTAMHEQFLERLNDLDSPWSAPQAVVENFTDFAAQCDGSFEKEPT